MPPIRPVMTPPVVPVPIVPPKPVMGAPTVVVPIVPSTTPLVPLPGVGAGTVTSPLMMSKLVTGLGGNFIFGAAIPAGTLVVTKPNGGSVSGSYDPASNRTTITRIDATGARQVGSVTGDVAFAVAMPTNVSGRYDMYYDKNVNTPSTSGTPTVAGATLNTTPYIP